MNKSAKRSTPKASSSKSKKAASQPQRASRINLKTSNKGDDSSLDFFDSLASLQSDDAIRSMDGRPVASRAWLDEFPTNDDGYVQLLQHVGHDNAARAARDSRFHDGGLSPCACTNG